MSPLLTLAIDVRGTRLRAGILDPAGTFVSGPARVDTPHPGGPEAVVAATGRGQGDRTYVT